MSSKNKNVIYKNPIDETNDYLVPLKHDYNSSTPIKLKLSKNAVSSNFPPRAKSFFSSIYFLISLLLYVGIPITQLVIGLVYIGQCPIQQIIVTWMIVSGVFGILLVIVGVVIYVKTIKRPLSLSSCSHRHSHSLTIRILTPILILILLFIVIWFFIGQVFIFEVKLRVEFFDPTLPEYCHGNLYKAAYILIFISYLMFLLVIILNILSYVVSPEESNSDTYEKEKYPIHNIRT